MFDLTPEHDFLVGIDSDGCAFDTMELKHKECFIPNTILHYGLSGVSKYAREAAEFVNLYSKSRGANRFPALIETLERLARRPEVQARGISIPAPDSLRGWVQTEKKLANAALEAAARSSGDAELERALAWSVAVNKTVEQFVHGVPPFPCVRECLQRFQTAADVLVVSATPNEALEREWQEHDLTRFVRAICGQDVGTKKEVLRQSAKYATGRTLMIGDAPGDYQAAVANGALFFPINPGAEEASWARLLHEGIDRFLQGTFAGAYQEALLSEFDRRLPEHPPWEARVVQQ